LPEVVPGIDADPMNFSWGGEFGSRSGRGANLPTPVDVQAPKAFCFREPDPLTRTSLGDPPPDPVVDPTA